MKISSLNIARLSGLPPPAMFPAEQVPVLFNFFSLLPMAGQKS
jgi:hypothetical protein